MPPSNYTTQSETILDLVAWLNLPLNWTYHAYVEYDSLHVFLVDVGDNADLKVPIPEYTVLADLRDTFKEASFQGYCFDLVCGHCSIHRLCNDYGATQAPFIPAIFPGFIESHPEHFL